MSTSCSALVVVLSSLTAAPDIFAEAPAAVADDASSARGVVRDLESGLPSPSEKLGTRPDARNSARLDVRSEKFTSDLTARTQVITDAILEQVVEEGVAVLFQQNLENSAKRRDVPLPVAGRMATITIRANEEERVGQEADRSIHLAAEVQPADH